MDKMRSRLWGGNPTRPAYNMKAGTKMSANSRGHTAGNDLTKSMRPWLELGNQEADITERFGRRVVKTRLSMVR